MTNTISVNYNQMNQIQDSLYEAHRCCSKELRLLEDTVAHLQRGGWVSDSGNAFFDSMHHDILPGFHRLDQALLEANQTVAQIYALMQAAEEKAAALIKGAHGSQATRDREIRDTDGSKNEHSLPGSSAQNGSNDNLRTPQEFADWLAAYHMQQSGPWCSTYAQVQILRALGRIDVTQEEYINLGNAIEIGTNFFDPVNLLHDHGLETSRITHNISQHEFVDWITARVAEGRPMIAKLDASILYEDKDPFSIFGDDDHVVVVLGVDNQGNVLFSDPNGRSGKMWVSADRFRRAVQNERSEMYAITPPSGN